MPRKEVGFQKGGLQRKAKDFTIISTNAYYVRFTFGGINFKSFPLCDLYYIYLLHVLTFEILSISRVIDVIQKTFVFIQRSGLLGEDLFYSKLRVTTCHSSLPILLLIETDFRKIAA